MRLSQNEILSLLFVSTGAKNKVSMKEIHEFLNLYTENGNGNEKYEFFIPMHDDFNLKIFKENDETGDFFIINPENKISLCEIEKQVLNVIKKDKDPERTINTINEYKRIYNERKAVVCMNNKENGIQKVKKLISKTLAKMV